MALCIDLRVYLLWTDCASCAVPPGRVVTTMNCVPPAVVVCANLGMVVMILVGVSEAEMPPAEPLGAAITMVCLPGVLLMPPSWPTVLVWLIIDCGTVLIIVVLPGVVCEN